MLHWTASHPLTLFWALGFLGVFQNVYFGQNGFLSAALLGGVLLLPPHLWFYDLPILTIALAWIGWEGYAQDFKPWEKLLLLCAWVAPYAAYLLLVCLKWPTGSLYLVPTIMLIVRRRWRGYPAIIHESWIMAGFSGKGFH